MEIYEFDCECKIHSYSLDSKEIYCGCCIVYENKDYKQELHQDIEKDNKQKEKII